MSSQVYEASEMLRLAGGSLIEECGVNRRS